MAGLWELPTVVNEGANSATALEEFLGQEGVDIESIGAQPRLAVRHSILDERITLSVHDVTVGHSNDDWRWATDAELGELPLTAATTKVLRAIGSVTG